MKTVIIVICILAGIAAGIFSFYGLFAPVNIQEKEMGPYTFFMKKHVGPYKDVGSVMEELLRDLKDDSIEPQIGIGIYYDNPKMTPEDKTRSIVGYLIEGIEYTRMVELEKKYSAGELPKENYLVVEFPYKGLPSIIIGIYRVYPKLKAYMKKNEIPDMPIIELYEPEAEKLHYLVPKDINPRVFERFLDKAPN